MLRSQRSAASLETEIRQLQDVSIFPPCLYHVDAYHSLVCQALKTRDEEISALEEALKVSHGIPSRPLHADTQNDIENENETPTTAEMARQASNESQPSDLYESSNDQSSPESITQALTPMTPPRESGDPLEAHSYLGLSPQIVGDFDALRTSLACGRAASPDELHLRHLDELMRQVDEDSPHRLPYVKLLVARRSMARKETAHKEQVESLQAKLAKAECAAVLSSATLVGSRCAPFSSCLRWLTRPSPPEGHRAVRKSHSECPGNLGDRRTTYGGRPSRKVESKSCPA